MKGVSRTKWPKEQIELLKQLAAQGYSAKVINRLGLINKNVNSLQKMMCRIGLAKKIKIFKFPHEINQRFKSFLLNNWPGKTPQELADLWSQENYRYPANKRRVIHYLEKLQIKIPYGEVSRINYLRKKEEAIKKEMANMGAVFIAEKIRVERIKVMRKRLQNSKDIWTGMKIDSSLLLDE